MKTLMSQPELYCVFCANYNLLASLANILNKDGDPALTLKLLNF